jgi:hypothetical protein
MKKLTEKHNDNNVVDKPIANKNMIFRRVFKIYNVIWCNK